MEGGTEWVRISFHGQSFMQYQIRKMVGLACRGTRFLPLALLSSAPS